jgi:hypothetical protein
MNLIQTYFVAKRKKGQVEYGSRHGGLWVFRMGKYEKITKVPGGRAVADEIALAFHKSWLRTDGKKVANDCERVDGTCRNTLERLIKIRCLRDHKPANGSWDNPTAATGTDVVMVAPAKKFRKGTEPSWHLPTKGISAEDLAVEAPKLPVVAVEPELAAK